MDEGANMEYILTAVDGCASMSGTPRGRDIAACENFYLALACARAYAENSCDLRRECTIDILDRDRSRIHQVACAWNPFEEKLQVLGCQYRIYTGPVL